MKTLFKKYTSGKALAQQLVSLGLIATGYFAYVSMTWAVIMVILVAGLKVVIDLAFESEEVKFAKWILKNKYENFPGSNFWIRPFQSMTETTEQIYEKYNREK